MAGRMNKDGGEPSKLFDNPALLSTVYGSVGSSGYYALRTTLAFAPSITQVIFVAAVLLFTLTTRYSEASPLTKPGQSCRPTQEWQWQG